MARLFSTRPAAVALTAGGVLVAIFAVLLLHFRRDLTEEIHRKIIERDAAVLHPVALQQLGDAATAAGGHAGPDDSIAPNSEAILAALKSAQQTGMLGVAVFDADGSPLRAVPASMLFVDLPPADYLELTRLKPISRYHPQFPLAPAFGTLGGETAAPVLEVLLPLHYPPSAKLAGVAQYFIDARPLARELAVIDARIGRQTLATLGIGAALVLLVVGVAYWGLARAQRVIAERNERLVRANFELGLAAKASVLGQITSHLLHGLQGPVAGLRAVMAVHGQPGATEDWQAAADYTDRLQAMIQETVALLGERGAGTNYELSGQDIARALLERHRRTARAHCVSLVVDGGFTAGLDSQRGNLLCLIAGNVIENAIQASPPGATVRTTLSLADEKVSLVVADEGEGIPQSLLPRLFQPGLSGRPGGTGLGLAISRLLALEIGADLALVKTGSAGTIFSVTLNRGTTG